MNRSSLLAGVLLLVALLLPAAVRADPPGRVGRLAEATGPVWLWSPGAPEWTAAPLNRPLTRGERLSADPGVRAVVRIGSTTLRLDGGTELEFVTLDDDRILVQLHGGSLAVAVRSAEKAGEIEALTADGRLVFQRAGRYRLDRADGATAVTVWAGQALFEGPGAALTVYPRQRGEFWMDRRLGERMQYAITEPLQDAFSGWASARDIGDDRGPSARYVSPEMTGAEDLDRHGRWEEHPEHGALWTPLAVPAGWAPYRYGQWAWVAPWGWTWIDQAPWGFAPFHYGRWVRWREAWAWAPGAWVARPVYAPALVAWVGGGSVSVGVQVGGGPSVGWFPLAPREVFVPWYGVSPRYLESVNFGHVRGIDDPHLIAQQPGVFVGRYPYAHRWYEPALTVAPGSTLIGQRPVASGGQRWILEPGARQAWTDPTRAPAVVHDPGLRPGWNRPAPGFPPGRPPPGAVEPDRRLQIPERVARPAPQGYADPSVGFPHPGGGAVAPAPRPPRPDEGAFPGQRPQGGVWSTVRPPPVVPEAPVFRGQPPARPPGLPGVPDTRANEEAARRIGSPPGGSSGRDVGPAPRSEGFPWRPAVPPPSPVPPSQPRVLQRSDAPAPVFTPPPAFRPPPPVAPAAPPPTVFQAPAQPAPAPRSFGRVEPPPRPAEVQRGPDGGRAPGGWDPHRQREMAR